MDPDSKARFKASVEHWTMLVLATGAFSGYSPIAPGTMGSLVGIFLVLLFSDMSLYFVLMLCLFLFGAGVWASHLAGKHFKVADSPHIVIDEVVGMMVAMIGIPVAWRWLIVGFLLFRFFDIMKLPPVDTVDRKLKNGWGVMLDDLICAVFTNAILRLMLRSAV